MLRLLAAKAKTLDQTLVLGQIFTLDVIKKLAAQSHHLQQPAAGRNIMFIRAQVFGQVGDALGQAGNLVAGTTGILFMHLELLQIDFVTHKCFP